MSADGTFEIEIGNTTRGNPADGNGANGCVQISAIGPGTVVLHGLLDVRLVNNYGSAVDATFDFLVISSTAAIAGKSSISVGLYAYPDNDRYFDVVTTGDGGYINELFSNPLECFRTGNERLRQCAIRRFSICSSDSQRIPALGRARRKLEKCLSTHHVSPRLWNYPKP